jgi:uncharacterized membrane protein YciS (DUF1049 family)
MPGKCATTQRLLVKIIFAVGLLAELGFRGVTILALLTAPRTCGQFFNCGTLCCAFFLIRFRLQSCVNVDKIKIKNKYY